MGKNLGGEIENLGGKNESYLSEKFPLLLFEKE